MMLWIHIHTVLMPFSINLVKLSKLDLEQVTYYNLKQRTKSKCKKCTLEQLLS